MSYGRAPMASLYTHIAWSARDCRINRFLGGDEKERRAFCMASKAIDGRAEKKRKVSAFASDSTRHADMTLTKAKGADNHQISLSIYGNYLSRKPHIYSSCDLVTFLIRMSC